MLPGYPARLSPAADGGAWLSRVRAAQPADRVRAAGGRLSRRHDAPRCRPTSGSRRRCRRGAASSSRCNAAPSRRWACTSRGRRAAPTGWSCGSMPICAGCPATTAAPTARATASSAPSSMTGGWSRHRKGGDRLVAVDSRQQRSGTDGSDRPSCEKMTKAYRGVPAVRDVDFELRRGEIHALLGENGAGKSTLTKIMAGAVEASSGTHVLPRPRGALSPRRTRRWRPASPWCSRRPAWCRR